MLIELHRKLVATEYSVGLCVLCGNDFDRGSVYAVARGDRGEEMGEMCPTCLEYLNRRKLDAKDPTLDNWPACDWPRLEDLEAARRRHPEPMFATDAALAAAATDREADKKIHDAFVVWKMELERTRA